MALVSFQESNYSVGRVVMRKSFCVAYCCLYKDKVLSNCVENYTCSMLKRKDGFLKRTTIIFCGNGFNY